MKIIKPLLATLSGLYLLGVFIFWTSSYWPSALYWVSGLLQLSPFWVLYLVPVVFAVAAMLAGIRRVMMVNVLSCIVIVFFIAGFNVPFSVIGRKHADKGDILRVVTCNMGTGIDMNLLYAFISEARPDIMVFQEAYPYNQNVIRKILNSDEWHLLFEGHMGIASRLEIMDSEVIEKKMVDGRDGVLAAKYILNAPYGMIYLFNVHLNTPRKGFESVINKGIGGFSKVRQITGFQVAGSDIVSRWAAPYKNVLIAGDFNMTQTSPVYKRYWSKYANAFSRAGRGFGYTYYSGWHGVRIDHILSDSNWRIIRSKAGPDVGSDHKPVIADMIFTGKKIKEPAHKGLPGMDIDEQALFPFEQVNKFRESNVLADEAAATDGNYTLQAISVTGTNQISIKIGPDIWSLTKHPLINFKYMIPAGNMLEIRVRTPFNQWLYMIDTVEGALKNDGNWHEITIDIAGLVKSALPRINSLEEISFFSPNEMISGYPFLIDDFKLMKRE